MVGAGVGALLWLGHGRGAAFLAATQGLCLVLVACITGHVRRILEREPAWQLLLSWVMSAAFVAAVVVLYEVGLGRWAEALMAAAALVSMVGSALIYYYPRVAAPDDRDRGDE